MASGRIDALVDWAHRHGARLHLDAEIYHDPQTGFSVRVPATSPGLEAGSRVLSCPSSLGLSYLNALLDGPVAFPPRLPTVPPFPRDFMGGNPAQVIGRFFLMQQFLEGTNSFWWPYIRSLPQPEHISAWSGPPFWPDQDVEYLAGTNAHASGVEIRANVRAEFKAARRQLKAAAHPGWRDYTPILYHWAYSIFTSRSFRPSLVLAEAAQHALRPLLPAGVGLDDFSILQPVFDVANHSPAARVVWEVGEHHCTLVTADPVAPGAQVLNYYGPKTNAELLIAYGFLVPASETLHNDYLHFRKRMVDRGHDPQQPSEAEQKRDKKPVEFLVSLRPMDHISSISGRKRQFLRVGTAQPGLRLSRVFSHLEDAFILDFALSLMTETEQDILVEHSKLLKAKHDPDVVAPAGMELQFWLLAALLADPAEPRLVAVLVRITDAFDCKLRQDLDSLHEAAEGLELDVARLNRNQKTALEYRERVEAVLRAAMASLAEGRKGLQGGSTPVNAEQSEHVAD
ncbi:hypothetical protein P8C59_004470 [Phyllachora maydis]|uniref:SET domain-containing protein n=1 Tax=Phyllachora maydis TaxID=1825666 RepID=A0AAD9MAF2_9PEZI|nr:hypothetical protein P8C59_004470 [Phyllachora maydis]